MKWTVGGGLPEHHAGAGQPVSGTHGPSTTAAPLSSMISVFVDEKFENSRDKNEEEGGVGRGREELNSPHTKRSKTQILGGDFH